jgi:hypothetical protein
VKKVSPREGRRENAQLDRGGEGGRERERETQDEERQKVKRDKERQFF